MTPSQLRAKLCSAVRVYGYTVVDLMREMGCQKAWLRPTGRERVYPPRLVAVLRHAGIECHSSPGYGGETDIRGRGFRVIVNQDPQDTEYGGGVYISCWKTSKKGGEQS